MLNTLDILALLRLHVKNRTGAGTDYRISKELHCSHATICGWKTRRSIDARYAIKIAGYCGTDARYLVACVEAEKAPDEHTRLFWESLARDFEPPGMASGVRAA